MPKEIELMNVLEYVVARLVAMPAQKVKALFRQAAEESGALDYDDSQDPFLLTLAALIDGDKKQ
jgi:hypothetical protein